MEYIFFCEKEAVCDVSNFKDVLKELFSLGYAVINRGQLFANAWALEVRRQ